MLLMRWVELALFYYVTWAGVLILWAGSFTFRAPEWNVAFQQAALLEAGRRGLFNRQLDGGDLAARNKMIGEKEPEPADTVDAEYAALWILSGEPDPRELEGLLNSRRRKLLRDALKRQYERVANVDTIQHATKIWLANKASSRASVSWQGARWLLPRFIKHLATISTTPAVILAVAGFFVGTLAWGLLRDIPDVPGLFEFSGLVATIGLYIAYVWGLAVLTYRWIVAMCGPPSEWSRKAIVLTIAVWAIVMTLFALAIFIGEQLNLSSSTYLQDLAQGINQHDRRALQIGAVVFLLILLIPIYTGARDTLFKGLLLSERIGNAAVVTTLVAIEISLFGLAIHGQSDSFIHNLGLAVFGVGVLLLTPASGIAALIEWFRNYRLLVGSGVVISRAGFVAAAFWGSGIIVVSAVGLMPGLLNVPFAVLPFLLITIALPLSAIPCFFAIRRTWRQVKIEYEKHSAASFEDVLGCLGRLHDSYCYDSVWGLLYRCSRCGVTGTTVSALSSAGADFDQSFQADLDESVVRYRAAVGLKSLPRTRVPSWRLGFPLDRQRHH